MMYLYHDQFLHLYHDQFLYLYHDGDPHDPPRELPGHAQITVQLGVEAVQLGEWWIVQCLATGFENEVSDQAAD